MAKQASANSVATAGKTRKRTVSKVAASVATEASLQTPVQELTHYQIAQHAYSLYLARGASEGGAIGDWLRAEHELRAQVG